MHADTREANAGSSFRILIVDDHPLYRDALAETMRTGFETCEVVGAGTLEEAFEALDGGFEPDLVALDLKLPDVTGISGFEKLLGRKPDAKILVISALATGEIVRSLLDRGAMGFSPKESSADALRRAAREVAAGRRYVPPQFRAETAPASAAEDDDAGSFPAGSPLAGLTPQQTRILGLIREGKPNKIIAWELDLAEATVKAHITALLRRLGVRNRTQAALLAEAAAARHAGKESEARAFLDS